MKIKQTIVLLLASAQLCWAGLSISNPQCNRNAGQTIPITITTTSPTIAYVWIYNAKTWSSTLLAIDLKLNKGPNSFNLQIPFSWWEVGNYVLRVQSSNSGPSWGNNIIRIRPAIIWPYGGSSFTRGNTLTVTWVNSCYINSDFFNCYLHNIDTDDSYAMNESWIPPHDGRFQFQIPTDIPSGHYRIELDGYLVIHETIYTSYGEEDQIFYDLSELTSSELLNFN